MTLEGRVGLDGRIDSVYFLMFPGWSTELRSNRWHYARRWARQVPVVLVQPVRTGLHPPTVRDEPRIPNVEILSISASTGGGHLARSFLQAGQVMDHMAERGHRRPLLWNYNPNLAGLYAAVPAAARIFHATENYYSFEGLSPSFLELTTLSLRLSDLVVAVSRGVAAAANEVANGRVHVVSNGCDVQHYAVDGPEDVFLKDATRDYDRVAVYAGNVNSRVDFDLLVRAAEAEPRTLFALFGPRAELSQDDREGWHRFCARRNCRYFGAIDVDRLPTIYRTADVGIIPYKQTRNIVESGFPLKALEMCATGLPVVTTPMEPLRHLHESLVVADSAEDFLEQVGRVDRRSLTEAQQQTLAELCASNDYNQKFEEVMALIAGSNIVGDPSTALDALVGAFGHEEWQALCSTSRGDLGNLGRRLAAKMYSAVGEATPPRVRSAIPPGVRSYVRRKVAEH